MKDSRSVISYRFRAREEGQRENLAGMGMDCMVVREGDLCCELATVSSLNAGLHAFWSRRKASSGLLVWNVEDTAGAWKKEVPGECKWAL